MFLTPSKRSYSNRGIQESNGKRFQKSPSIDAKKQFTPRGSSVSAIIFRILCPADKLANVTGEGESVITQIREETGAKIRVDELVPGCDERVIFIMGSDKEASVAAEVSNEPSKNEEEEEQGGPNSKEEAEEKGDDDKMAEDGENGENGEKDENDGAKDDGAKDDGDKDDGDKESSPAALEDSLLEKGTSAVQNALLLVFEKMIEKGGTEEEHEGEGDEEKDESASAVLRLLVLSSQVGCLLGKGGCVIKQTTNESGAQIRVLPRDKLPACASPSDEIVQITGSPDSVKKAIKSVSDQIMVNQMRERDPMPSNSSGSPHQSADHSVPRSEPHSSRSSRFRDDADFHPGGRSNFPKFHGNFPPNRINAPPEILAFRLLCPAERAGVVIGKGGGMIKTLQHETGCEIKVLEDAPDVEDRMIIISGPVHPDERISAVQDAVLRVQAQVGRLTPESKDKGVTARILVSSSQIGCLLGKGGSIIAEMRKGTGAYIRILGKDQIPKCASENEEVVQVGGEPEVVQEALMQITTRLRHHFFRDAFPSYKLPLDPVFPDRTFPLLSHRGRREHSPPGMFPDLGPSFRPFDSVGGLPPHPGFQGRDGRPPFMHDIHRSGVPHIPERPWGPQGMHEGGPLGSMDYPGGPQRRMPGFGGGSHSAIITSTKVEVVVPSKIVPAIIGENGGCLKQILQISDAKITITDPKPGATETVIIISGTPEQTHAAQSLIQAFVICETESS